MMLPSITISKADLPELEFIAQSQVAMARETENLELDIQTVRLGVRRVIESKDQIGFYLVARSGATRETASPVGCMLVLTEWSDWRNASVCWIHSLYVLPNGRKKGVFRRFYETLQDEVNTRSDLRGIRLYVDHTNLAAKEIYRKLGMRDDHYQMFEWMK